MAAIIKPRQRVEEKRSQVFFQRKDEKNVCGYAFDLDKEGKPIFENYIQERNYYNCLERTDIYEKPKISYFGRSYVEPAILECDCGAHVPVVDQYMGAFSCGSCQRWYNLFGQPLRPATQWEEDVYGIA